MSTNRFTPGPWHVSGIRHSGDLRIGPDTRLHAVGPDGDAVCMVFFDMETGTGWFDARLIASAPDLLEAAEQALNFIENTESELGITLESGIMLRAAIKRALEG
jgi:hypothetical protein